MIKKLWLSSLAILALASPALAVTGNPVQPVIPISQVVYGSEFKTQASTSAVTIDTTTAMLRVKDFQVTGVCLGCGGSGGSSSLESLVNGVRVSSPTASFNIVGVGVTGSLTGSATSTITLPFDAVGASTASLRTSLGTVATDTTTIAGNVAVLTTRTGNLDTSTATITTRLVSVGVSTAALSVSTAAIASSVNGKVAYSSFSANSPITFNNTTGAIGATLISLSTQVVGNLPAASIASGSLGAGVLASSFPVTGTSVGSYTNSNVTVNAQGLVTAISSGSSSGSGSSLYPATATPSFPFGATIVGTSTIVSTGTQPAINLTANGTYGTTNGSSGAIFADFTGGGAFSGMGMQLYTNAPAQVALGGVLNITIGNALFNEPAIWLQRPTNSQNNSDIRVSALGTPAITLEETGQSAPSSKLFQISVHNGYFRIEGRDFLGTHFDAGIMLSSAVAFGDVGIGPEGTAPTNTQFQVVTSTNNLYALALTTSTNINSSTPYLVTVTTTGVTSVNGLNVLGTGPATVTEIDGNTYGLSGTSVPVVAGNYAIFSSTNGKLISGGSSIPTTVGQYISSSTVIVKNFATTATYGDLVSIVLSSGDWDVTGVLTASANSAVVQSFSVGISTVSGNSSATLAEGDTVVKSTGPTLNVNISQSVPAVRAFLTNSTTYYLKYSGVYSGATPQAVGRISARKMSITTPPAVTIDSFTTGGSLSGSSPYNFNLGLATTANFAALGCAFVDGDSATSVTLGGVTMSLSTTTAKGNYRTAIYTLASPPTGAKVVSVNTTSTIQDRSLCWAASFNGASTPSSVDVSSGAIYVSGNGGFLNTVLTTTGANEFLFDVLVDGNGDSPAPGGNQTARIFIGNGSGEGLGSTQVAPTAGTYTQSWSGVQDITMMSVIAIKPGL